MNRNFLNESISENSDFSKELFDIAEKLMKNKADVFFESKTRIIKTLIYEGTTYIFDKQNDELSVWSDRNPQYSLNYLKRNLKNNPDFKTGFSCLIFETKKADIIDLIGFDKHPNFKNIIKALNDAVLKGEYSKKPNEHVYSPTNTSPEMTTGSYLPAIKDFCQLGTNLLGIKSYDDSFFIGLNKKSVEFYQKNIDNCLDNIKILYEYAVQNNHDFENPFYYNDKDYKFFFHDNKLFVVDQNICTFCDVNSPNNTCFFVELEKQYSNEQDESVIDKYNKIINDEKEKNDFKNWVFKTKNEKLEFVSEILMECLLINLTVVEDIKNTLKMK